MIRAIFLLLLFANVVYARDISRENLNKMGLGQMKYMTDEEGLSIRGCPTYNPCNQCKCFAPECGECGGAGRCVLGQRAFVITIQSRLSR